MAVLISSRMSGGNGDVESDGRGMPPSPPPLPAAGPDKGTAAASGDVGEEECCSLDAVSLAACACLSLSAYVPPACIVVCEVVLAAR